MFDTKFCHSSTSSLPPTIPIDLILSLLHDFATIIHLNPDTIGFEELSSNGTSTEYNVRDALAFIPKRLWNGSVSYGCTFTVVPDGCDIEIRAPGGFTSVNRWRVLRQTEQGGDITIRIESDARCSKTYAVFVKKFLQNSHEQQQRKLGERVKAAMAKREGRPAMGRRRSSYPN